MSRSLGKCNLIFSVLLFGILASSGCSLFQGKNVKEHPVPVAANPNKYTVHIENWKAAPNIYQGTFDRDITIEDTLVASGAKKKHRSMHIDLVRKTKEGHIVKMPAEYDTRKRRVKPEQDYHILPGR